MPKYSGGVKEIIKCIRNSLNEINIKKLLYYGEKMQSKSVLRRLGYILETIGLKNGLSHINKKIGKGYELFDPNLKRRNNLNKRWLLDVNI